MCLHQYAGLHRLPDKRTHQLMRDGSSMAEGLGYFHSRPISGCRLRRNADGIRLGNLNFSFAKELLDVFAGHVSLLFDTGDVLESPFLRDEGVHGVALVLRKLFPTCHV